MLIITIVKKGRYPSINILKLNYKYHITDHLKLASTLYSYNVDRYRSRQWCHLYSKLVCQWRYSQTCIKRSLSGQRKKWSFKTGHLLNEVQFI